MFSVFKALAISAFAVLASSQSSSNPSKIGDESKNVLSKPDCQEAMERNWTSRTTLPKDGFNFNTLMMFDKSFKDRYGKKSIQKITEIACGAKELLLQPGYGTKFHLRILGIIELNYTHTPNFDSRTEFGRKMVSEDYFSPEVDHIGLFYFNKVTLGQFVGISTICELNKIFKVSVNNINFHTYGKNRTLRYKQRSEDNKWLAMKFASALASNLGIFHNRYEGDAATASSGMECVKRYQGEGSEAWNFPTFWTDCSKDDFNRNYKKKLDYYGYYCMQPRKSTNQTSCLPDELASCC